MAEDHDRAPRRRAGERGNALVLMPTAVLIMFVLASLAIDTALTFAAQRRVADIASGIANDAASALAEPAFYGRGALEIDPVQAERRAVASLEARTDADELDVACRPTVATDRSAVTVRCTARVSPIVGVLRWIGPARREVGAVATATAARP